MLITDLVKTCSSLGILAEYRTEDIDTVAAASLMMGLLLGVTLHSTFPQIMEKGLEDLPSNILTSLEKATVELIKKFDLNS